MSSDYNIEECKGIEESDEMLPKNIEEYKRILEDLEENGIVYIGENDYDDNPIVLCDADKGARKFVELLVKAGYIIMETKDGKTYYRPNPNYKR